MKRQLCVTLALIFSVLCRAGAQEIKPVQLPPPQKEIGKPLMQAIALRHSSRDFDRKPLPLQELANLLWAGGGVNRQESGKRTAPSAMNWQETDIYVILADGAYRYEPKSGLLAPVSGGDMRGLAGTQGFVKDAPVNLVYVVDAARMTKGSDEERTMYGAADVGFMAENVYLYCASQTLAVVVRGSVDRARLAEALKLRPDQKIILCQTVGYAK
ncbi:MAG TPA: nitroreductase family protein [Bacteroidota bacterium]|nr:nitroreductase family protein [Bacteroidota bacterium]